MIFTSNALVHSSNIENLYIFQYIIKKTSTTTFIKKEIKKII